MFVRAAMVIKFALVVMLVLALLVISPTFPMFFIFSMPFEVFFCK